MKLNSFFPILLSVLIGLSCIRCTLDEGNPGSTNPALTLQVQSELSVINLSWAPVNVTGFKEYVLLQSASDIPNAPIPTVNQDVIVLTRIKEVNTTSFSTTNILFSPKSCYKLYCSVDDRFMYSGTVCADQSTTVLPGFFDRVDHDDDLPQIAMFDRSNIKLVAFTDADGTIYNSQAENALSFPQLDLFTYLGEHTLYCFDLSSSVIRKYRFPQLTLQYERFMSSSIVGGVAWKNLIFITFQNTTNGFQILNDETLSAIDTEPGLAGSRNIAVFDGDTTIVLEIGDATINRYQVNSLGKVIQSNQFNRGGNLPSSQNTCDFNATYYIGGRFATIINANAEIVTSLLSGVNSFAQLCRFSPDGTKAAILLNDINVFTLELYDISHLPAATKIRSYSLPVASFADMYFRENVINVIGVNFNSSSPQTFFLKFPM